MRGATVESLPLAFRVTELIGEVGEAVNLMKKIERKRLGISSAGTGEFAAICDSLADELADIVICCDLVAMDLERDLGDWIMTDRLAPIPESETLSSLGVKLGKRLAQVCALAETVEKKGAVTTTVGVYFAASLSELITTVRAVAYVRKIDLPASVARKFNATSRKLAFQTRMAVVPLAAE